MVFGKKIAGNEELYYREERALRNLRSSSIRQVMMISTFSIGTKVSVVHTSCACTTDVN